MSATLSSVVGTVSVPDAIAYTAERRSGNVVHAVIDAPAPVVTLGPLRYRAGQLELWCATYAAALAVVNLHTAGPVTIAWPTDPELAGIGMTYVVAEGGAVEVSPAEVGLSPWVVRVDYVEVGPQ